MILKTPIYALLIVLCAFTAQAQEIDFSKQYKEHTVHMLCQLMNDFYVHADLAKKTETHLLKQLADGHFNQFTSDEELAKALTESVQSINKDKHMRISVKPPYEEQENSPERMIAEKLYNLERSKNFNVGFNSVKVMEGNIGYLDLRGFAGVGSGKEMADAYMKLIANTDAVIIDLSKNGGGDPAMVQYLCSYFFDGGVHLNSLYFREGDRTMDFHTFDDVDGKKMIDTPLFVITGEKTFSGAEEFSYNMQTQKRATLVGQTTGGGANPGGTRAINDNLFVFIPTGMAINPITKTNWEGVGVIPEIKTTLEETLTKTHELAKEAAENRRDELKKSYTTTYMSLVSLLDVYTKDKSEKNILHTLQDISDKGLLQEWDINGMGYEYLMQLQKPDIALCIFRANTIIHNESANVHDSYAEALMMQGNLEESKVNYQKAIDLAIKHEDENLQLFKKNLQKVTDIMAEKK